MNTDITSHGTDRTALPMPTDVGDMPEDQARPSPHAAVPSLPTVHSATLLGGRRAVHIEHNGALYELRATRLGKLILTK